MFAENDGTGSVVGFDQQRADIDANTANITTNASNIAKNTSDISTLQTEVGNMPTFQTGGDGSNVLADNGQYRPVAVVVDTLPATLQPGVLYLTEY